MNAPRAPQSIPAVRVTTPISAPSWATTQRRLIALVDEAAPAFVRHYCREDGTLVWREDWPGMDGSDDAYEAFHTFPLHYALGGSEESLRLGRQQWDAMTWQFTEYGQVYREFDAYYDWMHHGESNLYLYYLGLADADSLKDRTRAARFAGFYTGADPEADNWDAARRMIRSPLTGSRGPRFEVTREDWSTHREVLRHFPAIWDDLPAHLYTDHSGYLPGLKLDWNDDDLYTVLIDRMNRSMTRGDVPLNLLATSLIAHAYLYDGEKDKVEWVTDYLDAWRERAAANGGILPDNIGPSGQAGELMDGKWWGGYYGWRWPRGGVPLLEAIAVAGENAMLLTGDDSGFDLARSQLDMLWALRKEEGGRALVPVKHSDRGWEEFGPFSPELPLHIWNATQSPEDLDRVLRIGEVDAWDREVAIRGLGPGGGWFRFITGNLPDYPDRALEASCAEVERVMGLIEADTSEPARRYVQHWVALNPVLSEALVQTTMGGPSAIYHGGLLHTRVRWFDGASPRPGLPADVAALVDEVDGARFSVQLVNLSRSEPRSVIAQAGAFGEHEFTSVTSDGDTSNVSGPWVRVDLDPGAGTRLTFATRRYQRTPGYNTPSVPELDRSLIRNRTPDVDPGVVDFWV